MTADQQIARITARQHGLVTTEQALATGLSPQGLARRVARGSFERVEPSVYRLGGTPLGWHQSVLAACLTEDALAFGRTAAALWGLDGFGFGTIEVVTRRWKRRVNPSVTVHESTDLALLDGARRCAIPVTTVARTIIDLGAVVRRPKVEQAFDDALRRRLTTPEDVRDRFVQVARRGRRGVGVLRPLLEARLGSTGLRPGEFERRVGRLLVSAGVAEPVYEFEVRTPGGFLVARVDLAYPELRVAIECDGYQWHSGRQRRQADLDRQNRLVLAGWTVLRFTWEDLTERPDLVVGRVRAALAAAA